MNNYLNNKKYRIETDLVISEEFFSYFYHFRDGVMHGDKHRAKHGLDEMEKYARFHFSKDLFRLAIVGMAECFSSHLNNKETVSLMKEVSTSTERAFDRLRELIEICCR